MANAVDTTLQILTDRIDNLEMKISYQDEVIDQLNKVIVDQWAELKRFQRRIDGLERQLREGRSRREKTRARNHRRRITDATPVGRTSERSISNLAPLPVLRPCRRIPPNQTAPPLSL